MREADTGLCYAMKNYIDESGRPHNILQIYRYKYSPLCIDSRLTDEDEQYIKHLGLIKLSSNTYRPFRMFDIAEFNQWAMHNGLVFSNEVYVYLDEHINEIGGVAFEPDHKPRKTIKKPEIVLSSADLIDKIASNGYEVPDPEPYMTRNKSASSRRNSDCNSRSDRNSSNDRGKTYNNRIGHASEDAIIEQQSSGYTGYNPRKKYTGSEDETAGLWYDFD